MKKTIQTIFASLLFVSPMQMAAQNTAVDFSQYTGSQVVNSDFEDWSGPEFDNVPFGWHSFESVDGVKLYVGFAKSKDHTSKQTTDLHEGTTGTACLKLVPRSLLIALANGTISTGQMIAGDGSATSPKNHAEMDISKQATSNGSPFYATLTERPAAMSVWVKFTQGSTNKQHPYATVSAAITNGNYYQEPTANNDSSVVIGYAKNNQISSNSGQWQHLRIPFRYNSPNFNTTDDPKAIMVTFSTNADPGQGNKGDVLLIDDMELIYTHTVTIPASGFATFANVVMNNHKVSIPEGLTAYTLGTNAQGTPIVKGVYNAGQVLPYGAAVLLKGEPGEYEFSTTLYATAETIEEGGDICLIKVGEGSTPDSNYAYYRLIEKDGALGFSKISDFSGINDSEALLRVKADMASDSYAHVILDSGSKNDVNGDGIVDVSDATQIVNRIQEYDEDTSFLISNADINGDGRINVADVMRLVVFLLENQ